MKIFYFIIIFLCLLSGNIDAQQIVKISGKIQNPVSDSVTVSFNDNRIAYYPKEFGAALSKTGSFKLAFPVPAGVFTQAELRHGNHISEIIIQPGDSLTLTVNADHFDSSIYYKGKGSEIQNFVAGHTAGKGRMNQYTLKIKEAINLEPAEFLKTIEKEKAEQISFLNKSKKGLPAKFVQYWSAYYEYYNYFFIQQYSQVHEMLKRRRFTDTIPETNYSVIKKMPLAFNDTFLQLPPYLLYLTGAIEIKLKAAGYSFYVMDTMRSRVFQDSVYKLVYKEMTPKSAEYYMAQSLYGRIRNQPLDKTRAQYKEFIKHWPKSEYRPVIDKQVAIAERLAPGQPAPDFDLNTADGGTAKLSSLKGKVVYMEFWASWCRQCVGEMMREQKVKDLVKNKPLEFVYISLDEDTASEYSLVRKYKIEGTFCNVPGGWNSKVAQLYGVQSLPAYFLINEDGNFAIQNPPSPNQPTQLILEIEKLFKE